MKRILGTVFSSVLILSLFTGCGSEKRNPTTPENLVVYTSFFTLEDFAEKVGGEYITVKNLMPPGAEPHDWEPSAQDMRHLEEADVFIYNGAGIDSWVESVLPSLESKKLVVVKTTEHVTLLSNETEGEGQGEEEHQHNHGAYDPHTWLSPKNAEIEMQAIMEGLIQADPEHRSAYQENYARVQEECQALDQNFRTQLAEFPQRQIVVAHAAYGYLCQEYGLTQKAVRGFSPDGEPSPQKMAEIMEFIKENGVTTIFFENNGSAAVAETIATDLNIAVDILYPIEALTKEEQEKGEDYFSLQEKNLVALTKALAK